jgi:hypothetical protein
MRLEARRAWWPGAVVGTVLVLAAPAPGLAREAGDGRLSATKRKPVTCKAAQTRVTTGGRVRCVTLPAVKADGDPRLSLLRELVRREPGTQRARRGKRIAPLWNTGGGRLKSIRARLLRALPKVLRFADGLKARASVTGDRNCPSGLAQQNGSFDGFSVTSASNGDVTMNVTAGGYAIEVEIGGAVRCSNLDLPACPMPDGALQGTDGRSTALGFRLTKDGALVQSLRTVVRSKQTLKGRTAVDAKLDDMTIEDVANETTTFRTPDVSATVRVSVRRFVTIDMRGGRPRGSPQIQVGVGGLAGADARTQADKVRRAYEQSFPDLMSEEIAAYRRRENAWQSAGVCAKLVFAPPSDTTKVPKGIQGTVTPHVEANAGGTATKARWTLSEQERGTFSPASAEAPSPAISYTPTGEDRQRMKVKFRATSTAGVAEGVWGQEIEDRVRYFKVTGLDYTDQLAIDGLPPIGGCTASTSQTNTTTFQPSGDAWDGAVGPLGPGGPRTGSLIAKGDVLSTAAFSGCRLNMEGGWDSCSAMSAGSLPNAFIVDVELPESGPAKVTWQPQVPRIGDFPPPMSTCVVFGGQPAAPPEPVTRNEPADIFTTPGAHTISLDLTRDTPAAGAGTLHSSAHYALTFRRVNADGSPYAG